MSTDLVPPEGGPVLQQFSKEQLVSRAKEFMRREYGRPRDLEPEVRERFYERLGLISLYIDWIWEPFND